VALGVVFLVASAVVLAWQIRRLAIANAGLRVPSRGLAAEQAVVFRSYQRGRDVSRGRRATLVATGDDGSFNVWLVGICWIAVASAVFLPMAVHNRRLTH
jgi:hypothetical protein